MKSFASAVVPASAERVWQLVRDFDGLPNWHSAIASSEIEGGGSAAEVGCVRHLDLAGGGAVRERLVDLDDADRSYTYDIVEGPFAVENYRSTIRVREVTDTDQAFVEWYSHYDANLADRAEFDKTFAQGVYATGLRDLVRHFSG